MKKVRELVAQIYEGRVFGAEAMVSAKVPRQHLPAVFRIRSAWLELSKAGGGRRWGQTWKNYVPLLCSRGSQTLEWVRACGGHTPESLTCLTNSQARWYCWSGNHILGTPHLEQLRYFTHFNSIPGLPKSVWDHGLEILALGNFRLNPSHTDGPEHPASTSSFHRWRAWCVTFRLEKFLIMFLI